MPIRLALVLVLVAAVVRIDVAEAAVPKPPRHAASGQAFKVAVPKRGKARWYLSRDSRRSLDDVQLIGPLGGRRHAATARVVVPAAPAGDYRLLACGGSRCTPAPGEVTLAERAPTQMIAFSDSSELEKDDYLASSLGWNPSLCPAPVAPRRLPSLAGALDAAEKLLANAAGAKGMAEFKASSAYRSAAAAEGAAVEAVAAKEPGAALAALLRAHDLEPNEPRYLVGAAAILTSLDHPAEALALLQGADNLTPTRSAPFGVNVQALALNAEGAALLALGRFDDAERYLRAAIAIEPLLGEAKQNLSIALMCRKQQVDGMRFLRAGLQRQAAFQPDGSITVPPLQDTLDLGHGTQVTLHDLPLPGSFREMQGSFDFYKALGTADGERFTALTQRDGELARMPTQLNTLSSRRMLAIVKFAWPESWQERERAMMTEQSKSIGKVNALVDEMSKERRDWDHAASVACSSIYTEPQHTQCFNRAYDERCTAPLEAAHQQFIDIIRAEEQTTRAFLEAYYPFASGVYSNIGDPVWHERWLISLEEKVVTHWSFALRFPLSNWLLFARYEQCGHTQTSYSATSEAPEMPRSEACPQSLKGVKLSWKIEAVTLEVNCEKVSVEASANVQGWFGVFGQLDWSPRSGKMTVFAGPKVGAKIPGTTIGGSFKDGLYVQFAHNGDVSDFGFRTSLSGSAGFGPFAIKGGESMDFSFAPIFGLTH